MEVRRTLDYAFLLAGIFFLLSLFVPQPLLYITGAIDITGFASGIGIDLIYAPFLLLVLAAFFIITRYAFVRNLVDNTIEFVGNCYLSAVGTFVLGIAAGIVRFPLAEHGFAMTSAAIFLGLYLTISSVRDLNELDSISYD
jgi:hypothetical protein